MSAAAAAAAAAGGIASQAAHQAATYVNGVFSSSVGVGSESAHCALPRLVQETRYCNYSPPDGSFNWLCYLKLEAPSKQGLLIQHLERTYTQEGEAPIRQEFFELWETDANGDDINLTGYPNTRGAPSDQFASVVERTAVRRLVGTI